MPEVKNKARTFPDRKTQSANLESAPPSINPMQAMTLYSVQKVRKRKSFMIEHITGPTKSRMRCFRAEDEASLAAALIALGVPARERMAVMEELRVWSRSIVKFNARPSIFGG